MKKFCFLVQARDDIKYFDKFKDENSDIFFLTFNKKIEKDNYIYFPKSTWTTGRNKLLEVFYKKDYYEYYVFLDDDIRIYECGTRECGIERFKELLMKHKPCIGFPNYAWHLKQNMARFVIPAQKFESELSYPLRFDPCVSAFHHSIIETILPYEPAFDKYNWWMSGEFLSHKIEQLVGNSIVQFNNIITINEQSASYPQMGGVSFLRNKVVNWLTPQMLDSSSIVNLVPEDRIKQHEDFSDFENIKIKSLSDVFKAESYIIKNHAEFWGNNEHFNNDSLRQ